MSNYYLDIETTGTEPRDHKIITIQYMPLDRNTSAKQGELRILKEWELGEKQMIQLFIAETKVLDPYPFSFVPVGYNLNFDHNFLLERSRLHGFPPVDILKKPSIDLRSLGVMMNRGEFKGSGLDKLTGKPRDGSIIPKWYAEKRYAEIEEYIRVEAEEFVGLCSWLYRELPAMLSKYKQENGIKA